LDGPGGSGKTFLLNCIIDSFRAQNIGTVAVATTGVAALLLRGGQTAHSGFKIPVKFSSESLCSFSSGDKVGKNLIQASLIIWDEAVAMHKDEIETVDRTLKDLMKTNDHFGGKTVIFSGDFRQTLPVVKAGVYPRSEHATLKSSGLWPYISVHSLKDNIRLGIGIQSLSNKQNKSFAQELLEIGEGRKQNQVAENIQLGTISVDFQKKAIICYNLAISHVYRSMSQRLNQDYGSYAKYLGERIILTTLNRDAAKVNRAMVSNLKTHGIVSVSIDRPDVEAEGAIACEALNKIDFAGFPSHELELRVGAPVVLLRNLNIDQGLCNGTRIVIEDISPKAIKGKILTGPFKDNEVLVPKITLFHEGDSTVKVSFY
jgi:hypothetical protein